MNPKVNWQRLSETLKGEAQRISAEIKKFDLQTVLSPAAQAKVKAFEKQYATVLKRLHRVQRQADREFNRMLRQVKSQQATMKDLMTEQRTRLEKLSKELRERFYGSAKKKVVRKKKTKSTKKKA